MQAQRSINPLHRRGWAHAVCSKKNATLKCEAASKFIQKTLQPHHSIFPQYTLFNRMRKTTSAGHGTSA
jgi:hypothetical protein